MRKREIKKKKHDENEAEFDEEVETDFKKYNVILKNENCLDFIPTIEKNSIDLLLIDPPYGMDFKSGWTDRDKIDNDGLVLALDLLDKSLGQIIPALKDDAQIYIFGNMNLNLSVLPIIERHLNIKNILIWDRVIIGMGDLNSYGASYDIIYFCYNEKFKGLNGVRDRDILSHQRVSPNNLIHPTEKPIDLLEFLIKKSSNENDVVCDIFAGGGSTIMASINLNRKFIGCELKKEYYDICKGKLEEYSKGS